MNALERLVLTLSSWLVPRARRAEWIEEWQGELWALIHEHDAHAAPRLLERFLFVSGAARHALTHRVDGWTLADLTRDFCEAVRRFERAPAFGLGTVLIVGLAVSANTAIFSVVNATLLRTPPGIVDSERLVQVGRSKPNGSFDALSYPAFADLRAHAAPFDGLAAFNQDQFLLSDGADVRLTPGHLVSAGYFRLLGVSLPLGVEFTMDDERPGAETVVISDGYWRRRFDSRADALGAAIVVNGRPVRIVGVAPPDFVGHAVGGPKPDLWLPLGFGAPPDLARVASRNYSWLWLIGRLREGVSLGQARDEMSAVNQAIEAAYRGTMGPRLLLVPGLGLRPEERGEAEMIVALLMASVALVLAIACANVAGLLLAQATARRQELAIRLALGASRFRLMREAMAESLLIAVTAAALAMAVSEWTTAGVRRLMPYELAVGFESDRYVVAFTAAVAIATGILIGVLPGARAGRTDIMSVVRDTKSGRPGWIRTTLVVVQVALSFVLVAGTAVLMRSLANIAHLERGFAVDGVLAASINLEIAGWDTSRSSTFRTDVTRALRDRTGSVAVGFARRLPVADVQTTRSVSSEPFGFSDVEVPRTAVSNVVDAGFFDTLLIPVVRGRGFGPTDHDGTGPVAIVSTRLARDLWRGEDPVGRQVQFGLDSARVIGVVRDVPARTLREPSSPIVYLPLAQHPTSDLTVVVRGTGVSMDAVRAVVRELAPGVPIARIAPLRTLIRRSMGATELTAALLGLYGSVTLLLAATGIYGLVAQATRERRREFGIRLAIGWTPASLERAIVGGAVRMASVGIVVGVAIVAAAGRVLDRLVLGVAPSDPISLAVVAAGFVGVAAGAAWRPARQAATVDPVSALKNG